jgi:hypothetical protein
MPNAEYFSDREIFCTQGQLIYEYFPTEILTLISLTFTLRLLEQKLKDNH